MDSNLDIRYRAWENAENVDVMEQMMELTEGEKTAISQLNIFLTVLSWKYNEQEYENIAQLLQTDENGTFEFEKLFYFEEDTKGINEYYVSAKDSLLQSILDNTMRKSFMSFHC